LLFLSLCSPSNAQEPVAGATATREELQVRYEKASRLYGEGKWNAAAEEFRWLSAQSPNTQLGSFATVYEAECLAEDGENERALTLLSNWLGVVADRNAAEVQGGGGSPSAERLLVDRARLRLADLAQKTGNIELAVSSYKVLAQTAGSPDSKGRALLALGKIYQSQADMAQANNCWVEVLQQSDMASFHDAARLGILVLQLSGEGEGAAVEEMRQLVEKQPPSSLQSAAAFHLGQFHYSKAQFDVALAMYEKVIELSSDSAIMPYAYIGAANSLYQLGRKDEAREQLERYLELYPTDLNWTSQVYQLTRWQLAAGDVQAAERWLERLHDIGFATNAEEIAWFRGRSLCCRVSRQYKAAADALRAAIQLAADTERFDLQKELLAVLLEGGEANEIDGELVAWIDSYREGGADELKAFFEVKRFELLAQRRDWATLGPLVAAWLSEHGAHPQRADVLLVRAQCEIGTVRIDEARTTLSDEVFKSPATSDRLKAQARWLVGETHFLQKDYVSAVRAYSAVVQESQDVKWRALAMLQAGKCYEIVGQVQDAVQLYEEALKLSPAESVKKQLESRLEAVQQSRTSSLTPNATNTIPTR
jgi:tetratricopeptide (TPR) repeat protein